MIPFVFKLTTRSEAVRAVLDGASITGTARRYDISRATLNRWVQSYDPDHPIASLRPKKTGPKAPRWTDEVFDQVAALIADHPNWWGKRRVAAALREYGITLSEATVSRMLPVAREQLAQERNRNARAQQVRRDREVRTATRRSERDAARAAMWRERLAPAWDPGLTAPERLRRIAQALAGKRYKIQVKDLTPQLRAVADDYIKKRGDRDIFPPADEWFIHARRWLHISKKTEKRLRADPNIDHLRVRALNHLLKNFGASAALLETREEPDLISLVGSE